MSSESLLHAVNTEGSLGPSAFAGVVKSSSICVSICLRKKSLYKCTTVPSPENESVDLLSCQHPCNKAVAVETCYYCYVEVTIGSKAMI
jgi:hypothetical protein